MIGSSDRGRSSVYLRFSRSVSVPPYGSGRNLEGVQYTLCVYIMGTDSTTTNHCIHKASTSDDTRPAEKNRRRRPETPWHVTNSGVRPPVENLALDLFMILLPTKLVVQYKIAYLR